MVYKAVVDFKDLQTGHEYKAGDVFPFEGDADNARIEQLITPTSQRGPLIGAEEAIPETVAETSEAVKEKKPRKSENKAEKTEKASKEKK